MGRRGRPPRRQVHTSHPAWRSGVIDEFGGKPVPRGGRALPTAPARPGRQATSRSGCVSRTNAGAASGLVVVISSAAVTGDLARRWVALSPLAARCHRADVSMVRRARPGDLGKGRSRMTMSKLEIKERRAGDVTVLLLTGQVVLDDGDLAIRQRIHDLLDEGRRQIVLDLGGVTYIDSSGVGMIAGKLKTVRERGGDMKLLNLTSKGQRLFGMMKLLMAFETFEDEAAAVKSFAWTT